MRHEISVVVDAPAELVWNTVVTVQDWPQWTPTVDSAERLEDGPLRVGSRTRVSQPKLRPAVWTVTELTPGTSFTWVSGSALLRMSAEHTVRETPQGTVVDLGFALHGPMAWPAGLLSGRMIRDYTQTEGNSLKAWCERAAKERTD